MKIIVSKKLIETVLLNAQSFLEKRDITQITSHIYIEATEELTIIKATDNEMGIQMKTGEIIVHHEGRVTANGKKLLDIVRILKDEDIILEEVKGNLLIRQHKSKFKLPTFNPQLFPNFPVTENKPKISLNSMKLIKSLKMIAPAIDTNNPKFELNGALIDIGERVTKIVGTDTRRLAIVFIPNRSKERLSLIIPKRTIGEIQKLFANEIAIHYDRTNIIIENENYLFFTRLINGKFPDYKRIIPKNMRYVLKVPKKEMIEAIKLITTVSQDIKLTFEPNMILFNSLTSDNINAKTELIINSGIPHFELNVNSRYLLDFISKVENLEFEIMLNEPTLPFVLKDNQFLTVIMPIIV